MPPPKGPLQDHIGIITNQVYMWISSQESLFLPLPTNLIPAADGPALQSRSCPVPSRNSRTAAMACTAWRCAATRVIPTWAMCLKTVLPGPADCATASTVLPSVSSPEAGWRRKVTGHIWIWQYRFTGSGLEMNTLRYPSNPHQKKICRQTGCRTDEQYQVSLLHPPLPDGFTESVGD